jgi:hypothetical protein
MDYARPILWILSLLLGRLEPRINDIMFRILAPPYAYYFFSCSSLFTIVDAEE